jgi:hypothetical protein
MRTRSTPQSALNLEITNLAIVECIVAIAAYVGIGVYLGTFKHLTWVVVVAPLMLFRTDVSAEWALKVYEHFGDWSLYRLISISGPYVFTEKRDYLICRLIVFVLSLVLYSTIYAMSGITLRCSGTLYWLLRKPLYTLREAPQNWLRQSLCTDFFHPPEIIPLEFVNRSRLKGMYLSNAIADILSQRSLREFWVAILIYSPFLLIGYLPSVVYRISFKATMVVYAPFIFIVHTTLKSQLSLKLRLERIIKGEIEKVRRWFSLIVVATLGAKAGLIFGWVDLSYFAAKFPGKGFVESFVLPERLPWWQVTLGIDALLTFFLLFFADVALSRIEGQQAWPDSTVAATVSFVSFSRASLALGTMAYGFHSALLKVAGGLMPAP